MPTLDFIRAEIERMRTQIARQRRDILDLQRLGISTVSAEQLLQRMIDKVDELCEQRDAIKACDVTSCDANDNCKTTG